MSITYNGTTSDSLGVIVEHYPERRSASRKIERVEVPGRNGDLTYSQNAYNNVILTYDCYLSQQAGGVPALLPDVAAWLLGTPGYLRLEDSYDTTVFRLAMLSGELDMENIWNRFGRFTLEFDAKPQQWLKTGETPVTISGGSGTLTNPTIFTALPMIEVYGSGSGSFTLNGDTFQISDIPEDGMIIDSELQDAYSDQVNVNNLLTLPDYAFPALIGGANTITYTGGVSSIVITPRWWRI